MTTTSAPRTARERARAELTSEIKAVARRQLAEEGSAALSLRAVARELGMVSSAVYRYFPSRDELLTALIIDAYDAVGRRRRGGRGGGRRAPTSLGRWLATCRAVRTWALANPQEYALIFGSPIPGYAAPQDTIDPAARIPALLLAVLSDSVDRRSSAWPSSGVPAAPGGPARPHGGPAEAAPALDDVGHGPGGHGLDPALRHDQLRAVRPPAQRDPRLRAHFDFQMRVMAHSLGLDTSRRP